MHPVRGCHSDSGSRSEYSGYQAENSDSDFQTAHSDLDSQAVHSDSGYHPDLAAACFPLQAQSHRLHQD